MSFDPSLVGYTDAQARQFFDQVAERARLVPGVKSAALASVVPMNGFNSVMIIPEGFQFPAGTESATLPGSMVDEHYFDTMGLAILKGRGFRATDSADEPKVAVVNEQLAKHYWPGHELRPRPGALYRTAGAAVLRAGGRARASGPRSQIGGARF